MKDISDLCQGIDKTHARETILKQTQPIESTGEESSLPPIVSIGEFMATELKKPNVLVAGILHQGSKMVIGGCSKGHKTFLLMDLAVSVAHGKPWLGMATTQGRVLYINFEIQKEFFQDRLGDILYAKDVALEEHTALDIWNLRGYAADLSEMMNHIIKTVKASQYALIIIDPIYKGMGERDENSAGDINSLLNAIERLAVHTGAAVVFGAHFSKGNQAMKVSMDRISGSGVFARDPDSILAVTKHENEDTYTIEATLRNFKPMEPFCVRWEHPLMVRDDQADPKALKRPGNVVERFPKEKLLALLGDGDVEISNWWLSAQRELGLSRRTFDDKKKALLEAGLIIQIGNQVRKKKMEAKEKPKRKSFFENIPDKPEIPENPMKIKMQNAK